MLIAIFDSVVKMYIDENISESSMVRIYFLEVIVNVCI